MMALLIEKYLPDLYSFFQKNQFELTVNNFIHKWLVCLFAQNFNLNLSDIILDFFFLADLSLLPVMTKWIMAESSTFAVANFGVVFLIAKILEYLIQYFGAKKTAKYSQIMNIIISRSFIRKVAVTLFLNIVLIGLSFVLPRLAMILYVVIPVISFLFPVKRNKIM